MNQDDIYNLLLIILLMSNEKENCDDCCRSSRSSLNELILTSLLMNSCSNRDGFNALGDNIVTDSCGRVIRGGNTTF